MGNLFDAHHLSYIFLSLTLTALLLVYAKKKLKSKHSKDLFLKAFAILTFALHISVLWIDYLKNGEAFVPNNVLFPIYFCNMSMYLLFILSFIQKKDSKYFKVLATSTAYAGTMGALISLFYPDYYLGAASMFEWGVFKSMVSHSTMMIGSLWLFIGGYVKINFTNLRDYSIGLLIYGIAGLIVNVLFKIFNLPDPNAMYFSAPPLSEAPFLNFYTMPILMLIAIAAFVTLYQLVNQKQLNRNYKNA